MTKKFAHVKPVKDRHGGGDRYYFRHIDGKLERLDGDYGSSEFEAHHARLMTQRDITLDPKPAPVVIPFKRKQKRYPGHELDAMLTIPERVAKVAFTPGSLGWGTERYLRSREFIGKPEGTRKNYKRLASLLIEHPLSRALLGDIRSRHVIALCRELQEERGLSRGKAMLAVISNVWEYVIDLPEVRLNDEDEPVNPARVAYRKIKYSVQKQHKRWPVHVCKRFLSEAPDHLHLMFNLLLFTGQRRSDVQGMKWEHYNAKTGVLNVWQKKPRKWVPVPVHKRLAKILAETPRNGEFILTSAWGQHYRGESSLSHAIRDRLIAVGIPDGVYTPHGLRVTAAHILAEAGAKETQMMRIFGWKKPDQAHYYIREANAAKIGRAGMNMWEAADDAEVA